MSFPQIFSSQTGPISFPEISKKRQWAGVLFLVASVGLAAIAILARCHLFSSIGPLTAKDIFYGSSLGGLFLASVGAALIFIGKKKQTSSPARENQPPASQIQRSVGSKKQRAPSPNPDLPTPPKKRVPIWRFPRSTVTIEEITDDEETSKYSPATSISPLPQLLPPSDILDSSDSDSESDEEGESLITIELTSQQQEALRSLLPDITLNTKRFPGSLWFWATQTERARICLATKETSNDLIESLETHFSQSHAQDEEYLKTLEIKNNTIIVDYGDFLLIKGKAVAVTAPCREKKLSYKLYDGTKNPEKVTKDELQRQSYTSFYIGCQTDIDKFQMNLNRVPDLGLAKDLEILAQRNSVKKLKI